MPQCVPAKPTPLVNRTISKTNTLKVRSSPRLKSRNMSMKSAVNEISKTSAPKIESLKTSKTPMKENITNSVKLTTPKPKDNRPTEENSATKSAKKSGWKRRPTAAHSGVPVPEKMKMIAKLLRDNKLKL